MLKTKRGSLSIKFALAVGVLVGMLGCNATVPPAPIETVGQLAPTAYGHSVSAPVHHDAPPEFLGVVGSDDDQDDAPKFRAVDEPAQAPDAVDKSGGLKTGEVR